VSAKYKRQQNVGACTDYVQVWWSIFLLFWRGKVRSGWLPQTSLMFSLKMLPPPHAVTK
jgi:hypothetical protein